MATAKRPRTDDHNEDKEEVEEVLTTSTSKNGAYLSFRPVLKEMRMHDPEQSTVGHCPTSWFFMLRNLKFTNHGPYMKNKYNAGLASWMMHAILDVPNPDPAAPGTNGCWTCAVGNESWAERAPQVVLEALRFCILAEDPRLTGMVWLTVKRRAGSWTAAQELIHGNSIFARLLFKDNDQQVIQGIAFLALVSRRPRLLNAVLESYKLHVVKGVNCHRVSKRVAENLTCIALAIADCVFSPNHKVSYDESYKAFQDRNAKATQTAIDTAQGLGAWRDAVANIFSICGYETPPVVMVSIPDNIIQNECVLRRATRYGELYPELLDDVLNARAWKAPEIESAMRLALPLEEGVRGPNFQRVYTKLYAALLYEWKSNPDKRQRLVACDADELAGVWKNISVTASGYDMAETGKGGNALVPMSPFLRTTESVGVTPKTTADSIFLRHPQEWEQIFTAMISAHDPESALGRVWSLSEVDTSLWNTKSLLFASLVRHAIRKILNEPNKTKLLVFFINALEGDREKNKGPGDWLSLPTLFNEVALYHPLALGLVLEHAAVDSVGKKHFHVDDKGLLTKVPLPLTAYHEALNTALFLCMQKNRRQSARQIINALRGHLNPTINYSEDGEEVCIGLLPYYVKVMGEGATEEMRNMHGEDYGIFINARVEEDFKMLLNAKSWPEEALDEALRYASYYQRSICAAQLMAAPWRRSPGDDAYLMAIDAWMHEPDNPGAKQAEIEFLAARDGDAEQE